MPQVFAYRLFTHPHENEKINALFDMIKPEFKVDIKQADGRFISEVSL